MLLASPYENTYSHHSPCQVPIKPSYEQILRNSPKSSDIIRKSCVSKNCDIPYKQTTCIARRNDVETTVFMSFQRGIHVVHLYGIGWLFCFIAYTLLFNGAKFQSRLLTFILKKRWVEGGGGGGIITPTATLRWKISRAK